VSSMGTIKRILLIFFILVLVLGWITNPLLEDLVNLKIGIFGFFGIGTYFLIKQVYPGNHSIWNVVFELFMGCLLLFVIILFFNWVFI
jgi:hypothetical protein